MASNHAEHDDNSSTPADDCNILEDDPEVSDDENIYSEAEIIAQLGFSFSNFGNSTRVKGSKYVNVISDIE